MVTLDLETTKGLKRRRFVPGAESKRPDELQDLKARVAALEEHVRSRPDEA